MSRGPTDREEDRDADGRRSRPATVILPTREWGPVAASLARQLRPGDELLVVCDRPDDPVAGVDTPRGVRVLVAGEPAGCSGKANAVARGMAAADNDRFVWTDDDFPHPEGWLDELLAHGRDGPASAVPYFYGDGWWRPLEPWIAAFVTLGMYLEVGDLAGVAWGGGATFAREDLDVEVDRLVAELRQVLSDDELLSNHLRAVEHVRSMVEPVRVAGDRRSVVRRGVRFARIAHVHHGVLDQVAATVLLAGAALWAPRVVAAVTIVAALAIHLVVGGRLRTAPFAFLGTFSAVALTLSGVVCREFEWGGRRYRLEGLREVTVVSDSGE